MSEYSGPFAVTLYAIASYLFGGIHIESAFGAVVGSFFFLSLPSRIKGFYGFLLWILSIGAGYAVAIVFARSVDPFYQNLAMLVGIFVSSMASTILTALQKYFDGGPLPDFISRILDRIPFFANKRSSNDAS